MSDSRGKPSAKATELRTIRSLESQLGAVRSALSLERQKRGQAESELALAQRSLDTVLATKDRVARKKLRPGGKVSRGQATAILCCNDWHVEGCVTRESVDGANEFNLAVADRRIRRTWQKALYLLDFARHISDIRDLVVWLGGDLINGAIHEELEESNFLGPAEAVLYVQDHVAAGLDLLLREAKVDGITVVTSYGNHGRTTKKRRISTGYRHSWEWLAYSNLARHYRQTPKVAFKVEQGYHNWLPVQGYDVRFHHGDAIRYAGGVGGVTIPLRKKIAQWNKRRKAYLDVIGHFHQFIDGWDFVGCGCLVGYLADTAVEFAVMDAAITETGAQGPRAFCEIFSMNLTQELENSAEYEFTLKPTYHEESSVLIEPEWFEVGDVMTEADQARWEALVKSAFAAEEDGTVAVTVRDLRWLVCLIHSRCQSGGGVANESPEAQGEKHEREAQ